jgi:pimeloyl-ACP methyl ester carboxylesterase
VPSVPFRRLPFRDVPQAPRLPHPYDATSAREVTVETRGFGRMRMHVREHGSGPPLLLVHGLMTSSYSYRYVLSALGERHRLFIPDLPGAGRSDKPHARYTASAFAEAIVALVDALGIRGCPAVGNSLGGYLCMRAVLSDEGLFDRLVNIHSPGMPELRLSALSAALKVPGAKPLLAWMARRDPERWVHRNVHYWDETLKSREEARTYGEPLSTAEGSRAFAQLLADVLAPPDLRRFVRELEARRDSGRGFPVPLLLLYARRDPMVPPGVGQKLARLIPDAELRWVEDTSHFMHVDSPDRVVPMITEFLGRPRKATG